MEQMYCFLNLRFLTCFDELSNVLLRKASPNEATDCDEFPRLRMSALGQKRTSGP